MVNGAGGIAQLLAQFQGQPLEEILAIFLLVEEVLRTPQHVVLGGPGNGAGRGVLGLPFLGRRIRAGPRADQRR